MLSKNPRNVERRQKYADDSDYRSKMVQSTRDRYRREHGLAARGGANHFDLRRIGRYCERHDVWIGSQFLEYKQVMTVRVLALIIGRKVDVVRRWIDQGMLPRPIGMLSETSSYDATTWKNGTPVYFLKEAREVVHAMRKHQDETPYFRQDHDDTIDLLRSRLSQVRESL